MGTRTSGSFLYINTPFWFRCLHLITIYATIFVFIWMSTVHAKRFLLKSYPHGGVCCSFSAGIYNTIAC